MEIWSASTFLPFFGYSLHTPLWKGSTEGLGKQADEQGLTDRVMVLQVWSPGQQQQHHMVTHQKCKLLDPHRNLLTEEPWNYWYYSSRFGVTNCRIFSG